MAEFAIQLKPGRQKSVYNRHPWLFSGAVAEVVGDPEPGETVAVYAENGEHLGWAAYSPVSSIRARLWTWDPSEVVDESFLRRRLTTALDLRRDLLPGTSACRLVHAESDGLPGLVVDQYGDWLVVQCLSAGIERWRETIYSLLMELTGAAGIYERSDVEVRRLEGLPERTGLVAGDSLPDQVVIDEFGLKYKVDLAAGQKTGFYIDQRRGRALVREISEGREVLDAFSYSGAFTVCALSGGAKRVLSVDASASALDLARGNVAVNGLDEARCEWRDRDVFKELRTLRDSRASFDLIILDPPKFAPTAALAQKAARGYKDINLLAFKLLRPGGLLLTFSCSGGISADLFSKIVAGAALDAGVQAQVVEQLHQGADHPIALNFPEGAYLKGLLCRVDGK
jgi:23S rRNA (cytosine1962-C5)-methyltransferase